MPEAFPLGVDFDPNTGLITDPTLDYGERSHSAGQSIGSGVWTMLHLDTATITSPDPKGAQIVNSVDTLQILRAGIYSAYAESTFDAAAATGSRGLTIQLTKGAGPNNKYNLAENLAVANTGTLGAAVTWSVSGMFEITTAHIAAGTPLLTLWAWQDNGGAITIPSSIGGGGTTPGTSTLKMGVFRVH